MAKDKLTNHFVANVSIMGKPVSYFALEKCKKIPKKTVLGGRGGGGGGCKNGTLVWTGLNIKMVLLCIKNSNNFSTLLSHKTCQVLVK